MNAGDKKTFDFMFSSYAKVNLFLEVKNKREDGYHSICTLFSEIDLHDKMKFTLTKYHDIKLLSNIAELKNQDNLIYKVAVFIQGKYSVNNGAKIELEKNIPIAAGLGGGSSNCATTIMGLNKLWNLNLDRLQMHDIAAKFGSDINFFLEGFQAIGTQRGEQIEPVKDKNLHFENILLVNPGFAIMSSEAYENIDYEAPIQEMTKLLQSQDPVYCFNRLESGILKKYPILSEIFTILYTNGAKKVLLSGSGPTVIGFFQNPGACENAQILMKNKGFWSYITLTRRRQNK